MTHVESLIENLKAHQLMVAVRTETAEDAYNAAAACIKKGGSGSSRSPFSVPGLMKVIKALKRR